MKTKPFALFLALFLTFNMNLSTVNASGMKPYTTNIGYLGAGIVVSGTCLAASVTGSFVGPGLHAIYYCEFQYESASGEYIPIGDQRTFRSYTEGMLQTYETYYCNPTAGVRYRFHVLMKVVDDNGTLLDSDFINSSSLVFNG